MQTITARLSDNATAEILPGADTATVHEDATERTVKVTWLELDSGRVIPALWASGNTAVDVLEALKPVARAHARRQRMESGE